MKIEFGQYKVSDVGKFIKDSKKAHMWVIYYNDKRVEVIVKESLSSKKFRFYVQKTLIREMKIKNSAELSKGIDFEYEKMYFVAKKISKDKYDLYVNNNKFVIQKVVNFNDNGNNDIIKMSITKVSKKPDLKTPQTLEKTKTNPNEKINMNEIEYDPNAYGEISSDEDFSDFDPDKKILNTGNNQNKKNTNFDPFDDDYDDNKKNQTKIQQNLYQNFNNPQGNNRPNNNNQKMQINFNKNLKVVNQDLNNDFLNFDFGTKNTNSQNKSGFEIPQQNITNINKSQHIPNTPYRMNDFGISNNVNINQSQQIQEPKKVQQNFNGFDFDFKSYKNNQKTVVNNSNQTYQNPHNQYNPNLNPQQNQHIINPMQQQQRNNPNSQNTIFQQNSQQMKYNNQNQGNPQTSQSQKNFQQMRYNNPNQGNLQNSQLQLNPQQMRYNNPNQGNLQNSQFQQNPQQMRYNNQNQGNPQQMKYNNQTQQNFQNPPQQEIITSQNKSNPQMMKQVNQIPQIQSKNVPLLSKELIPNEMFNEDVNDPSNQEIHLVQNEIPPQFEHNQVEEIEIHDQQVTNHDDQFHHEEHYDHNQDNFQENQHFDYNQGFEDNQNYGNHDYNEDNNNFHQNDNGDHFDDFNQANNQNYEDNFANFDKNEQNKNNLDQFNPNHQKNLNPFENPKKLANNNQHEDKFLF